MQSPSRGPDGTSFVGHREIECSAVCQTERQLGPSLVQARQVQVIQRTDAPFHLERSRHRFVFDFREVLVDGQMVVDASEVRCPLDHVAFVYGLLNQALHNLDS